MQAVNINETDATKRRILVQIFGTDGLSPATGEAGGQPTYSIAGAGSTNSGVLVADDSAKGLYYTELPLAATQGRKVDEVGRIKYKSGTSAEVDVPFYFKVSEISLQGTATAGGTANVTLPVGASSVDDFYLGHQVEVIEGLGAGQTRDAADYVGASRVLTPSVPFNPGLDNTSVLVLWKGAPTPAIVQDTWAALLVNNNAVSGSFGELFHRLSGSIDGSGRVVASNFVAAPSASTIAQAILANPANKLTTDGAGAVPTSTTIPTPPTADSVAQAVVAKLADNEEFSYSPIGNPTTLQVQAAVKRNGVPGTRTLTFARRGDPSAYTYELVGVGTFT